jgi:hypothetical protein
MKTDAKYNKKRQAYIKFLTHITSSTMLFGGIYLLKNLYGNITDYFHLPIVLEDH